MGRQRDTVIAALRSLVVEGELKPGVIFSENEMAERFGVSRTPVREAVAMLTLEGLLDQIPQVGVAVHVFDEKEIDDLLKTRDIFEPHIVARLAELPATAEDIEVLKTLMDEMRTAADAGDRRRFLRVDALFHTEIARRAGYALAAEILRKLSNKIRVVGLSALFRDDGMDTVLAEHQPVLDAIEAHDGERASTAMGQHLDATRRRLEQSRLASN
jgi:GntR family transcriptional regulator, rspAB operon transcriptional repressor